MIMKSAQQIIFEIIYININKKRTINLEKKMGKWMSICCTVGHKLVTVMDGMKFEFNNVCASLYTNNDSERKRFVSLNIFLLLLFIIACMLN